MSLIFGGGHFLRLPQRCAFSTSTAAFAYAKTKPENKYQFQVLLLECLSLKSNLRT